MYLTEPIAPPESVARVVERLLAELSPHSDTGLVSVEAKSDRVANVQTEVSIRLDPTWAADDHNWELVYDAADGVVRELGLAEQVPFLMTTQPKHYATSRVRQEVTTL